jgi:hypothetical protein
MSPVEPLPDRAQTRGKSARHRADPEMMSPARKHRLWPYVSLSFPPGIISAVITRRSSVIAT